MQNFTEEFKSAPIYQSAFREEREVIDRLLNALYFARRLETVSQTPCSLDDIHMRSSITEAMSYIQSCPRLKKLKLKSLLRKQERSVGFVSQFDGCGGATHAGTLKNRLEELVKAISK